ncbi:MAG: DUF3786 domain-containing protein [Desulfomonilaceae bacterium]|nr:DUF3786 domain-containing protein [Desulfomonilaceae bacterium]
MGCAAPHPFHWDDLRNCAVDRVIAREGVTLSKTGNGYELTFLNAVYEIDPAAERINEISPDPSRELTEMFQILLIQYLLAPIGSPIDGKDISEKDCPGGVTFFQGPHALYVRPIAKLYGRNPDAFEERGRDLNAVPVSHGDAAMRFFPFPEIPVTYVLWAADDEFPASVSVLFDSSITRWFELDMIFSLVWVVTERIVEGGQLGEGIA